MSQALTSSRPHTGPSVHRTPCGNTRLRAAESVILAVAMTNSVTVSRPSGNIAD